MNYADNVLMALSIKRKIYVYWDKCSKSEKSCIDLRTRNQMRVAIESGKGMKVKVIKLC